MGIAYNPAVVTNGLVLALDAGNQKSLNIPTQADHGYAEWYCLLGGTAVYSIEHSHHQKSNKTLMQPEEDLESNLQ